jgi:hypothetical protein
MIARPVELQGYASLFGVADLVGDVVHAGAFSASGRALSPLPMLLEHDPRCAAGVWQEVYEDTRGLFVRGRIDPQSRGAPMAQARLQSGLDGLSIGFRVITAKPRPGGGRDLTAVALLEVSLVRRPMLPRARLVLTPSPSRTL